MQKSSWWPLRPTYGYEVKGKKKRQRQGLCHRDDTAISSSSSGNTSTANNFNISWLISTKLGPNNPYLRGIMSHDQQGVKGHVGVRGVKKVIFH